MYRYMFFTWYQGPFLVLQTRGLPPSPLQVSTPPMPPAHMKLESNSKKTPSLDQQNQWQVG